MPPAAMNFSSCLYVATTGQLTNEESKNHAAVKNQSWSNLYVIHWYSLASCPKGIQLTKIILHASAHNEVILKT